MGGNIGRKGDRKGSYVVEEREGRGRVGRTRQ